MRPIQNRPGAETSSTSPKLTSAACPAIPGVFARILYSNHAFELRQIGGSALTKRAQPYALRRRFGASDGTSQQLSRFDRHHDISVTSLEAAERIRACWTLRAAVRMRDAWRQAL
jgi:hypothetical protein